MKRNGLGIRGSGLGRLLGWGFLLSISSLAVPVPKLPTDTNQGMTITVRVYDYARGPGGVVRQAETEASRIFRQAGVKLEWLDCPTSHAEEEKYPACEPPLGAMAVDLRIVPSSMAARLSSVREEAGVALPSPRAGSAPAAWVFYQRVEELAASQVASAGQILGHAIAHEIGHLLLGPNSHSPRGIMRANWDRKYLEEASRGQLLFTREQARLIRADVQARIAMSEASVTRQPVRRN